MIADRAADRDEPFGRLPDSSWLPDRRGAQGGNDSVGLVPSKIADRSASPDKLHWLTGGNAFMRLTRAHPGRVRLDHTDRAPPWGHGL